MNHIYGVVFSNNIVKFGRTTDLLRRVIDHKSAAAHHGVTVVKVVTGLVIDAKREESAILDAACQRLEQVLEESFEFSDINDVGRCFDDIRLPYMTFTCGKRPFCLIFGAPNGTSTRITRKQDCRDKVLDALDGAVLRFSGIRDRLMDFSPGEISSALSAMVADGLIERKNTRDIFSGREINDIKKALFRIKGGGIRK